LGEVKGLLRTMGFRDRRLVVLSCDSAVRSTQQVFSAEQVHLHGGGGTNMGEALEAAAKLRPRPEVVVVLTDGVTPWPDGRPPFLTIVGMIGPGPPPPSWARMVRVDLDEEAVG